MVHIEVITDNEAGELYRLQGNDAFRRQAYDEAIHFYSEAMNYQKTNASVYTNRAAASLKVEAYLQAEADCTKALDIDPLNPKAFNRRAQARQALGNLEGAIEDFTMAQKNHPDQSITANLEKCKKTLAEKGESRAAELAEEKRRLEEAKTNIDPDALRAEARTLFQAGDYDGAVEKYSLAIDSGSLSGEDMATFLNNRAACFIQMKHESEAVADLNAVLDMDAYNSKARLRRALLYENMEKYSRAYDDYKALMQVDPSLSRKASEGIRRLLQNFPELRQRPAPVLPARK